jgi:hypothetical protein
MCPDIYTNEEGRPALFAVLIPKQTCPRIRGSLRIAACCLHSESFNLTSRS